MIPTLPDALGLSATELLDAWEQAAPEPAWARPLRLLAAASQPVVADLAALTIGERDHRLLGLRRSMFGSRVQATATCPACGEPAELELSVDDLAASGDARLEPGDTPATTAVHVAGHDVTFRLPTTVDLAAIAGSRPGAGTADAAAAELLARCVVTVRSPDGSEVELATLPAGAADVIATAMADADPLADILLSLSCPACRHHWDAPFDIGDFLWREVEAWVQGTLLEVDVLARAYGWPEPEVLALTPWRRRRYVELAGR